MASLPRMRSLTIRPEIKVSNIAGPVDHRRTTLRDVKAGQFLEVRKRVQADDTA